jgi:hypothetical protein
MLRRHEQQAAGGRNLGLEPGDVFRQVGFQVLIIKRQVINLDRTKGKFVRAEPGERFRESAIEGFAAIAADDNGDIELCHGEPTLVKIRYRG